MYGQGMGFSNWFCGGNGFMGGGLMGMIFMVLFWAFVIGLVIKVIQYFFSSGRADKGSNSLNILKERYAAGEITKIEFEQIKKDIS